MNNSSLIISKSSKSLVKNENTIKNENIKKLSKNNDKNNDNNELEFDFAMCHGCYSYC